MKVLEPLWKTTISMQTFCLQFLNHLASKVHLWIATCFHLHTYRSTYIYRFCPIRKLRSSGKLRWLPKVMLIGWLINNPGFAISGKYYLFSQSLRVSQTWEPGSFSVVFWGYIQLYHLCGLLDTQEYICQSFQSPYEHLISQHFLLRFLISLNCYPPSQAATKLCSCL